MKLNKTLAAVVASISILFISGGRACAQVNAEQVLNIGRNVLSMEDYMLSIQYFNQAIKAKPYLSDPYFFRGLAKLHLEDYKGAEEDCTLALERNSYKTETYKVRGFARQFLGKDSLAVADYNIGLRYNPQDKYFLFYKGVAQTTLKQYAAADSTFSTLLRIYPGFEDGYTARARMYAERGDTTAALADLDRATHISGSIVGPFLVRAEIKMRQKDWEGALADMDEVIRLQPQETDFYINRAFIRYNNDDYFGAMADYNYTLELEPYNTAALFNRALLRYEVKDLDRSASDLEEVLRLAPDNFHARFNHGLVNLERGDSKGALADFRQILKNYPRYYPAYYGLAEAYRDMGDMKSAMQNARHAEDLVKKYVKNPKGNPLDRPAIAAGESFSSDKALQAEEEDPDEVADRFNRLVTIGNASATQLSYNEKIKGKVQDRELPVEAEPSYALSFIASPASLKSVSNYFRELDDFNQRGYIPDRLYLTEGILLSHENNAVEQLFNRADYYRKLLADSVARPADLLALGVVCTMLKNYPEAIEALDKAIEANGRFTPAYMARAYAERERVRSLASAAEKDEKDDPALLRRREAAGLASVIADYDRALLLNPNLIYAWFNKGNLYYETGDYTSAMQSYAEALKIDPSFGTAYYNRGLCYLRTGNKRQAFSDLSKAGELGVIGAYPLLKRMK